MLAFADRQPHASKVSLICLFSSYRQTYGVPFEQRKLKDGKLGVFWHTQGSGKSYSMVFFAQKVRRKFAGSPTFVILTESGSRREKANHVIGKDTVL